MNVGGRPTRTIRPGADGASVDVIDQTLLPHRFATVALRSLADAARAIREMTVRGAPLIGATAAFGYWLGLRDDPSDGGVAGAYTTLLATRPTAINLRWALELVRAAVAPRPEAERAAAAHRAAVAICEDDVAINRAIGEAGLSIIRDVAARKGAGEPVNILTHCNAGWLATVDWGTATAPIYRAHEARLPVHVWVDETRPRNQGFNLTAWELLNHGVPHTCIVDNAGGHLMQRGRVDLVIVGSDRTTATGDVCNKIGTYLKALAARDNDVPFYVALPSPTIDWSLRDGAAIPIEERDADEVTHVAGLDDGDATARVRVPPAGSPVANPGFDVTPGRLVTGLITERGVCAASEAGLRALFPERARP
jgi:methylthioribose-1-phosphate isomerase